MAAVGFVENDWEWLIIGGGAVILLILLRAASVELAGKHWLNVSLLVGPFGVVVFTVASYFKTIKTDVGLSTILEDRISHTVLSLGIALTTSCVIMLVVKWAYERSKRPPPNTRPPE